MDSSWTSFDETALSSLFFLGHKPGDAEKPIGYPREHRPHLAYYGTTDSGKSFAIEYALAQIAADRSAGFCLIDPHGALYWRLASYLRQNHITERVLFWDINDPEYVVTYDPFALPKEIPASAIASGLTKALLGTLGEKGATASDQPLLKTLTETGLRLLIDGEAPFILARELFDPSETQVKRALAAQLPQSSVFTVIADLPNQMERFHQLVPTYRRIDNVFAIDHLRLSFAGNGLDFKQLMEDGWLVLVNVASKRQDVEAAYTFTRLLVSHLLAAAKDRNPSADPRPFFLVIDEASRYLSRDVADVLTQARKFGVHLMAGMQGLEQAKLEDPYTYLALRECTAAEVVMRLLDPEEKAFFAKRFYQDYLDFKKVKHTITAAIPRVESHTVYSRTHRHSSGTTIDPETERRIEHSADDESETETPGQHVEYDYEKVPFFFTPEEQLLEAQRAFSRRNEGEGQRFGVARVNELEPCAIEIPELPPPLYSPDEMIEWLRTFKASQPATLPLIEAKRRYDALLSQRPFRQGIDRPLRSLSKWGSIPGSPFLHGDSQRLIQFL